MISIWDTNSKVSDISNKLDALKTKVDGIQNDTNPYSQNVSLKDVKDELDELKNPGLSCTANYLGGMHCSIGY